MAFQARRGKHTAGARAHHLGGSVHVAGPSPEHPQGVWHHDPYERPEQPDHIHKANGCTNHLACPPSHWVGGRPEREHPHHVEFDGSTGRWGYTRLTAEEISDLQVFAAFEAEQLAAFEAGQRAGHDLIRERAAEDPAFAALARMLGITPS